MSDLGHLIWKWPYALFLSLVLFCSLFTTTTAFEAFNSAPTQCGPLHVAWDDSYILFNIMVLPFDARPIIIDGGGLITASRDKQAKTFNYTLNNLPLKSGTQFVLAADYGFVGGSGGTVVSLIQTVGDSSNSTCVSTDPDPEPMSSFFTLNPPAPSQCSNQTVSWNATRYQQAPRVQAFIPGGQNIALDYPTTNTTKSQSWIMNIRAGTQVVLLLKQFKRNQADVSSRTSPLFTVTANSNSNGDACLSTGEIKSTVTFSSTTETPDTAVATVTEFATAIPASYVPAKKVKTPVILASMAGALFAVAIIGAVIALYRRAKRKRKISAPKNSTLPTVFPGGGAAQAAAPRKRPLGARDRPTSLDRSFGNVSFSSKRPLMSQSVDLHQTASSPDSFASPSASVTRPAPTWAPPGLGVQPHNEENDRTRGRARPDGRSEKEALRGNMMGAQSVRPADAGGVVGISEQPPSYNELQSQRKPRRI